MLVSVAERTREIGLRLAVGASGLMVQLQFLGEAVLLGLCGGLLGLALDPGLGKGTGNNYVYTAYTHFDLARRADPAPDPW